MIPGKQLKKSRNLFYRRYISGQKETISCLHKEKASLQKLNGELQLELKKSVELSQYCLLEECKKVAQLKLMLNECLNKASLWSASNPTRRLDLGVLAFVVPSMAEVPSNEGVGGASFTK